MSNNSLDTLGPLTGGITIGGLGSALWAALESAPWALIALGVSIIAGAANIWVSLLKAKHIRMQMEKLEDKAK
jgi:heme/copper-type cytochrome/quinol oxidase subunit 1